jgi:hypothetical protein
MEPEEAVAHEKDPAHKREREGVAPEREEGPDDVAAEWPTGLLSEINNREYEGSSGTLKVRVSSWLRGVAMAAKGDEEGEKWKMEEDYPAVDNPPYDEETKGWGVKWPSLPKLSSKVKKAGETSAAKKGEGNEFPIGTQSGFNHQLQCADDQPQHQVDQQNPPRRILRKRQPPPKVREPFI